MKRDRRLVAAAPPAKAQPKREVHVLEVGEEALVEAANCENGIAAIKRRARAGAKNLLWFVVAAVVAREPASLLAGSVTPQNVTRVIHLLGVVELEHLGGDGRSPLAGRQRLHGSLNPVASNHDIRVHKRYERRGRGSDPAVGRVGKAGVAAEPDHPHLWVLGAHIFQRPVIGAVVDDDHLRSMGASVWSATAARHAGSQRRPFQFGMIIVTGTGWE